MKKGENIYKRKDGRWEGRYSLGYTMDGKLKYGYIYGKSYQEVRRKLYPLKTAYQTLIATKGTSGMLVSEWVNKWLYLVEADLKPATFGSYMHKLNHYVLPRIGNIPLNKLSKEDGDDLFFLLRERLSPASIQVIYQIIKKCLKSAVEMKLIQANPFESILLPSKRKQRVRALTVTEQRQLEKAAEAWGIKGMPAILSLYTGLRIGEIAALKWSDIDLTENLIFVSHTYQRVPVVGNNKQTKLVYGSSKTDSSTRVIPIGNKIKHKLAGYHQVAKGEFVFSTNELPCEPRLLTYYFHKIRGAAELPSIHFHQLRHTFATRCLEAQADIASVSALLGHTSTQMTLDIYADALMEQRIKVIQALEDKT